tara:strand:+ start:396 stop:563 length:168 start_codon:yes stop_codon:yes gene_type:complete
LNQKQKNEFYLMALLDINNGASYQEMYETMKMYEQHEEYEACAGIQKAIIEQFEI